MQLVQRLALASPNIECGKVGFLERMDYIHSTKAGGSGCLAKQYRIAERHMVDTFCTPDAAEGTRAMMEKRKPMWT